MNNKKPTTEEYQKSINHLMITVNDKYINNYTRISHRCDRCDDPIIRSPKKMKLSKGCNKCAGGKRKLTSEEYSELTMSFGIFSCGYSTGENECSHRCLRCYYRWDTRPSYFKKKGECPKCLKMKTDAHIENDYRDFLGTFGCRLIGNYNTAREKIEHQFKCRHLFSVAPTKVTGGQRCKTCSEARTSYQMYKNKPTTLYLIDMPGFGVKPGLSQKPVPHRYIDDCRRGLVYSIIDEIHYEDGWDAWKHEQFILDATKNDQIFENNKSVGCPLKGGNTEIRAISSADVILYYFERLRNQS